MGNLTGEEKDSTDIQALFCAARSSGKHWIFLSTINFLFAITAIFGNTLILIALHKESSLRPPSKLLYRCLAITDLLMGLITEPVYAFYFTLDEKENWLNFCFFSAAITTVSFTILTSMSLITMTAISVDRLLALLLGLRYREIVTLWRVQVLVVLFWIASIAFASVSFWKYIIPKGYNYTIILLCLFISAICYSKIFLRLRHHKLEVQSQNHQEGLAMGGLSVNLARYKKSVSAALSVLVTLLACYLPYSIIIVIITSYGSSSFLDVCWELTSTLICLNSSLNPILYCWKMQAVRQELKNTIRQLLCFSS